MNGYDLDVKYRYMSMEMKDILYLSKHQAMPKSLVLNPFFLFAFSFSAVIGTQFVYFTMKANIKYLFSGKIEQILLGREGVEKKT